ncbi:uncharacterized protein LOC113230326 [Hyposmocoma kahamanoa]|uniref:uncharacterized protein LOC113230326 n=1 Tax=Hyposmocoma kahamanoa TaxID=1477025 RepID=UPI000E6D5CE9|nr:uncharacterized protein LOC113230326 [Hyposmocoma kahamanoa]
MCLCGGDKFFGCLARAMYMTQKVALCLAAVAVVTCLVTSMVIAGGVGVGLGYHYCVVEAKTYQLDIQTFRRAYNKKPDILKRSQNLTDVRAEIESDGSNGEDFPLAPFDDSDGQTSEEQREGGERSEGVSYGDGDSTPNDRDGNAGREVEEERHPPVGGGSTDDVEPSAVHLLYKNLDDDGDVAEREEERKKGGIGRGRNITGDTRASSPPSSPSNGLERHGQEGRDPRARHGLLLAKQHSPAADDSIVEIISRDGAARDSEQLSVEVAIRLFREELQEIRREIREFRGEFLELRASLPPMTARMDDIDRRLDNVEERMATNVNVSAVKVLEEAVANLQLELHNRDQERLDNDVLITNVVEGAGESVLHIVATIGTKLGVKLDERDIVCAERLGVRREGGQDP